MRFSLSAIPLFFLAATILLVAAIATSNMLNTASDGGNYTVSPVSGDLHRFSSGDELVKSFVDAANTGQSHGILEDFLSWSGIRADSNTLGGVMQGASAPVLKSDGSSSYSTTNVQVAGVDEADSVKTDGEYIYLVAGGKLIIAKAYPASDASILWSSVPSDMTPKELFIDGDRMLVFGTRYGCIIPLEKSGATNGEMYWPYGSSATAVVELYDVSDRASPKRLKTFEVEGSYLTSRQIGHDAYFVVNSYPRIWEYPAGTGAEDIIPLCRDGNGDAEPVAQPTDIGFIPGVASTSFITIASVSMTDENRDMIKETVAGSGQNVYASLNSLYIAETCYPASFYDEYGGSGAAENTTILKYDLKDGRITSAGTGSVRGHILNQFSMDERDGFFRIATTVGEVWNTVSPSKNNVYVLDGSLHTVGALEDIASGEKIYSCRFMGDRCYMVTFKKVDPLFVIDLSNPRSPQILGKLKIPGYSDYLHPYDETHIIGIGKDAVDASEGEVSSRGLDFAWYQGIKIAIFDVSDVEHPVEMFKELIGDRGTDSPVLTDHRAFLFDREKGLLVLPVTVAEITGQRTSPYQYGDYVFQGAYVYHVDLTNGFRLRGKVTHYDSDDVFKKSGYYFYGDRSITRSLYIDNVLYTLSNARLQLNDLGTLGRIKVLDLSSLAIATPGPTATPTPKPALVADFYSNVTTGTAPLAVQFIDGSAGSPSGWQWSWGDLTANATTRDPVHIFYEPGVYTVTLTVTDRDNSSTKQNIGYINVTLSPAPTPTLTPTPVPTPTPEPTATPTPTPKPGPVAGFSSNVTSGTVPLVVQFTDESMGSPTGWQWSWGDLTANDTVRNPVHVFNTAGLYTVTLTVTNADGSNTTWITDCINATAAPEP